ncbi:hypothetical protein [Ruminococcus sp.]
MGRVDTALPCRGDLWSPENVVQTDIMERTMTAGDQRSTLQIYETAGYKIFLIYRAGAKNVPAFYFAA